MKSTRRGTVTSEIAAAAYAPPARPAKPAKTPDELKAGYATLLEAIRNRARIASREVTKVVPAGFYLAADHLAPEPVIENRPTRVYFSLWNHTPQPISGYVEAEVQPIKSLTPYAGEFVFDVRDLKPGESLDGVITFTAPRSDRANVVTLKLMEAVPAPPGVEFYGFEERARDSLVFDVAARYTLTVDTITVFETASFHEDTLVMAVGESVGGVSGADAQRLGDHNNGSFAVSFPGAGPFDSVPGLSPPSALSYIIANAGHSADEDLADEILNIVSDIGAAVATAAVGAAFAPLSAAVDALHHLINDTLLADCDTVVVLDAQTFTSQQLYDLTFDPFDKKSEYAKWSRYTKRKGDKLTEQLGGGCRDSDYNVRWKVMRHRAPEEVASLHTDQVVRLDLGQETCLDYLTAGGAPVAWEWALEGPGMVDNFGCYRAPATSQGKFAVVSGTGLVDGVPKFTGFTVVMLG